MFRCNECMHRCHPRGGPRSSASRLADLPPELLHLIVSRLNVRDRVSFRLATCERKLFLEDDAKLEAIWQAMRMGRSFTQEMAVIAKRSVQKGDVTMAAVAEEIASVRDESWPQLVAIRSIASINPSEERCLDAVVACRMAEVLTDATASSMPPMGWPSSNDEVGNLTMNRALALASTAAFKRLMETSTSFRARFDDIERRHGVAFFVAANHGNLDLMQHLMEFSDVYGMTRSECLHYLAPSPYNMSTRPSTRVQAWTILQEYKPEELINVKGHLLELMDAEGLQQLRARFGV